MKNTILYAVIFSIAFAVTTLIIYNYNEKYVNIFEFDFRESALVATTESLESLEKSKVDVPDSSSIEISPEEKNNKLEESIEETKIKLERTSRELNEKEKEIEELKSRLVGISNSKKDEWLSSTVKLYEAMESRKAGDILSSLPEKEARDLIYSMKKKKAAEILSSLDIETVKRLTRAKK